MNKFIRMMDFADYFSPRQSLSMVLATLLVASQLPAQSQKTPAAPHSAGLKIYVLEGNGAVNYIPDRKGTTPVVEVRDDNELPVNGATVEFRLPETGPGGDFPNGQHTLTAITGINGQAQAPFTVRPQTGSFKIQVIAKIDTRSAVAVIPQTNSMKVSEASVTKPHHPWYKNWKVLTLAGAGVTIVAVLLATRGGGSSSGTTVGITPGVPTYGAPH